MAGVMGFPQPIHSVIFIVVVIIAGSANYGGVEAQSSGCATSMATLSPCVGYITSNVTTSPPPQSCCTALSSVVQTSAVCLCQFITNNPFGIPINQTQALALPGACKISTPALTRCKVAGVPAPAPAPVTGPSIPVLPPTGSVPSSSPAPETSVPNAPAPTSQSPSLLPPTTPVAGISPAARAGPTANAGFLFTPSTVISVLAGAIVLSAMY